MMQSSWAVIKVKFLACFLSLLSVRRNERRCGSKGEQVTGERSWQQASLELATVSFEEFLNLENVLGWKGPLEVI